MKQIKIVSDMIHSVHKKANDFMEEIQNEGHEIVSVNTNVHISGDEDEDEIFTITILYNKMRKSNL